MDQAARAGEPASDAAVRLQFSHVGLFVTDMAKMTDFYHRVLGFPITDRGFLGDAELVFFSRDPRDHHQIVLVAGRPPGLPDRIVNQVSFRVGSLAELKRFHARVRAEQVRELIPICHGNAWSVYFRDPEGNRIEVFLDTDWYVHQPLRETIDLDLPEAEIRRITESLCRGQPGFMPIEEWRAGIARKIAAADIGTFDA
jgi:catechol 2,3-dioxygenase-like lactoylglutathione lyase family enzyme